MSLLQPMFNEVNSFSPGHMRSRSHNELLKSLNTIQSTFSSKKRSFNDLSEDLKSVHSNKRSRTAPPSPPSPPGTVPPFLHPYSPSVTGDDSPPSVKKYSKSLRSRSLSPGKKLYNPLSPVSSPPTVEQQRLKDVYKERIEPRKIKLPSISSALNAAPLTTSEPIKLKPIAPTVSLDYFDTYKPNDENWRYELLDSINRGSKHFNLNQYNYLNKHSSPTSSPSSSSAYSQPSSFYKPNFDSRISSRITKPTLIPSINHSYERKINFPYESNYTYLNKTYLNDVEKYPEYLELAQSLIQLSKPKQTSPHSPLAGETHSQPEYDSQHQYQHQQPHQIQQQAQVQSQPQTQPQHEQYQHQLQPIPQRQTALAPPPIVYAASMVPPPITTSAPANYYTSPQAYSYHNVYETPSQQQYQQSPQNMEQHVHSQVAAVAVQSLPVPGQVPSLVHHVPSAIYAAPIFQGAQTLQAPASAMMIPPIAHQSPNESIHEIQDKPSSPVQVESLASTVQATQNHRFIPITPPSKAKSSVKSPPKNSGHSHNHNHNPRICISCGSDQSPCWRPSWSIKEGQLCNSCGLRYKKTSARCLNTSCKKIPAKGDWSLMQSKGKSTFEDGVEGYSCLECGWRVEVKK